MVSVSMRQTDRKVMVSLPGASRVAKLERKDLASYIYIGTPTLNIRVSMVQSHRSSSTMLFAALKISVTSSHRNVNL